MNIKIVSATIVRDRYGADIVYLHVELPSATWPFEGNESLKLVVARGQADEYMNKNLPGVSYRLVME